ncbi:MAG: flagellar biosynthetic protein FliR [Sporolactobacillus sp.]
MVIFNAIPAFLLILVRIASFLVTAPIFSYRSIPAQVKIGLAVALSVLIDLTLFKATAVPLNADFILLVLKETLVGLSLGFVAAILMYAVHFAGSVIDLQMGFAIANTISPENNMSTPLSGQLFYMLELLFFFGVNAHYMLLSAAMDSFRIVPLTSMTVDLASGSVAELMTKLSADMLLIAMQMAIPIVGSLFLVDVAVGIVARTVPQINVFVVGMPLKIFIGFVLMLVVFPAYIGLFRFIFDTMTEALSSYLNVIGSS